KRRAGSWRHSSNMRVAIFVRGMIGERRHASGLSFAWMAISSVMQLATRPDCRMTIEPDARYRALLEHLAAHRGRDLSELELRRIRTTLAVIPHDVSTVVDVGCGDGRIVGRLPAGL